jgi:hypothetical protein
MYIRVTLPQLILFVLLMALENYGNELKTGNGEKKMKNRLNRCLQTTEMS